MITGCDLHIHSNNSDGSFPPEWIILEAKRIGLIVALTDHNTTMGLESFMVEAEKQGVTAVPGVELSTVWDEKELHLLGMFIDREHYEKVENLVKDFHILKEKSNVDLIQRLNEGGYKIDYAKVKKRNVNGHVNRAHIASELVELGYVSTPKEAFDKLLKVGKGFYFPPERLKIEDAIRFVRSINAVPVLAHPLLDLDAERLLEILPALCEAGLMGLETRHSTYTEEKEKIASEIAKQFGLLESGGSDFHGEAKPDISIGKGKGNMSVPESFYYKLLDAKSLLDK